LASFLATGIVVFLGFRILANRRTESEVLARIQGRNLTQAMDQNISGTLQRIDLALGNVIGELDATRRNGKPNRPRMEQFLAMEGNLLPWPGIIWVADSQGRAILGNRPIKEVPPWENRWWFLYCKTHPDSRLVISKPLIGFFTKQWVIPCVRRYNLPNGDFGGVVVIPLSVDHLQSLLSGYELGVGGVLTIRDSDGGFIARYPKISNGYPLEIGNTMGSVELKKFIRSGAEEGIYFVESPVDKLPRIFANRRLKNAPLIVGAGIAQADYLAHWYRDRIRTLAVMGISLLGIWTFTWFLWHSWESQVRNTMALSMSEERFRLAMDATSDGIWDWNVETGDVFFSPAYTKMLGYDPDEFAARSTSWVELIVPEDRARVLAINEACIQGVSPGFEVEYRMKAQDGTLRWILGRGKAIVRDSQGHALRILGTHVDVTRRKQIEEALREGEERYRSLFNNAEVGMFRTRLDGSEILDFNDRYLQLLGRTADEVLHKPSTIVWPDPQKRVEMVQRLIADGQVTDFEMRIQTADGKVLDCLTSVKLFREESILEGSLLDITERKQAESALRDSEARLQRAESVSRLGNWELDLIGRKFQCSAGARKIYGLPGNVWPMADVQAIPLPEYRGMLDLCLKNLIEHNHPYTVEFRIKRPNDGQILDIQSISEYDPERHTVFGVIHDITDRKKAEKEKIELQTQLQQARKMESLGTLAGGVAHDMNNVLGAILGLASANLETLPAGSPAYRAFDTISRAATRGGEMVKSLLGFARQDRVEERELDLNAILQSQVSLLERTTLSKVHLDLDLEPGLRPIRGDASAISNTFMNLCVNAVDAMPDNGILTLRTRNLDSNAVEIVVEDTGTGMPKEVLDRAMEPFFTTKEVGKGTGLGLSMVYRAVKAHQGQIHIRSAPGEGTQVRMRFPACEPAFKPTESITESISEPSLRRLNVLLVDDDELIQSSIGTILQTMGHTVITTPSGEEALATIEAGIKPDVVILDMNMPGLGGSGTLPRLRTMLPEVPVLLSTGRADQATLDLAKAYPFVTLLPKPFNLKELQQHLSPLGQG